MQRCKTVSSVEKHPHRVYDDREGSQEILLSPRWQNSLQAGLAFSAPNQHLFDNLKESLETFGK